MRSFYKPKAVLLRRQDAAAEALPSAVFIAAAIIDPRRLKLDRSRAQSMLARMRPAVVHHQGGAESVAIVTMALDVSGAASVSSAAISIRRSTVRFPWSPLSITSHPRA